MGGELLVGNNIRGNVLAARTGEGYYGDLTALGGDVVVSTGNILAVGGQVVVRGSIAMGSRASVTGRGHGVVTRNAR